MREDVVRPRGSDLDHLRWLESAAILSFRGKKILDLGCGSGYLCAKAIENGAEYACGVDIELPPDYTPESRWTYLNLNLDEANWPDQLPAKFDYVLAFDILEHLAAPPTFLSSCRGALAKGGTLVLTTPNLASWERHYRPQSWSGVQDPQHKVLFSRYSLNFLLGRCGFETKRLTAPMRSLSFLGPLAPNIGGQIFCLAEARF